MPSHRGHPWPWAVRRSGAFGGVVPGVVAASIIGVLPIYLTGALGVFLRDQFGWSAAELGAVVSSHFVVSALSATSLGRAADRLGWRRSIGVACGVSGLSLFAASAATSGLLFAMAIAMSGAGNALVVPGTNLAILRHAPTAKRGLVFGVKQAAVPTATLAAGLAVPWAAGVVGWRSAFALAGTVGLALAANQLIRANDPGGRAVRQPPRPHLTNLRRLVVLALAGGLGTSMAAALATFLVSALMVEGRTAVFASVTMVVASLGGISMRVLVGAMTDRRGDDGLRLMGWMLGAGAVGLFLLAQGSTLGQLAGGVLAFGAGWGWPGLLQFAITTRTPERPGAATGIVQVGLTTGAALGPPAFGWAIDAWSYAHAWVAAGTAAVAASLMTAAVVSRGSGTRGDPARAVPY